MSIQENIEDIIDKNGPLSQSARVPNELINEFQGKLPDTLIELWKQQGFGTWGSGLYRMCNPHDFDGLLSQVFHADKDFSHQDCHVIGYSAFGHLSVWSERHWLTDINLLRSEVVSRRLIAPEKKKNPDTPIVALLYDIEGKSDSLNVYDDNDKPLFARAKKKLGILEPGECYGFAPALAMGGAPNLENLSKMKANEHFLFLAQLQNFTLIDYLSRPVRAVRQIG